MNNNLSNRLDWKTILRHGLLFLLPFSILISEKGVGLCSFIFVLTGLFLLKQGRPAMARHGSEVCWVLIAFLLNFLCVLASYLLRADESLGSLEKSLRMLFAASALLYVLALRPDRKSLWWGVMGGAVAGAVFVSYQRWGLGLGRPGGLINAITYGDLALCLGLLSLAAVIDFRGSKYALWPALAALAGLIGSIATGTRGGWLALIVALLVFLKYSHVVRGRVVAAIGVVALTLLVSTYLLPQTGVRDRVEQGVNDVQTYFDGGSAFTSIGLRFERWKAAARLIRRHPLVGAGIDSYKAEIRADVAAGELSPLILTMAHMHNDALQVLVTGGVLGFAAWAATLLAPLLFFLKTLNRPESASKQQIALALAGVLLVLSYISFGLTEVIFWSMRSSLFYALMIFLLIGLCLNAKEHDGK